MVVLVEVLSEHGQWSVARSRRRDRDAPQAAQIDRSGPDADPRKWVGRGRGWCE